MSKSLEDIERTLRREFADAARSRVQGNEGRVRVCARRAAGWAVGWYVETNALAMPHTNALEHLRWLARYPQAPAGLRNAAARLITKIDKEGRLPFQDDPIADARTIIKGLLGIDAGSLEVE